MLHRLALLTPALVALTACATSVNKPPIEFRPVRERPTFDLAVGYVAPQRGGAAIDAGGYQHTLQPRGARLRDCTPADLAASLDCEFSRSP
ncbi:MAG TPA: hypothetical protein PLN91_00600 [Rhodanobacteraceae bacterium]|nr:hypothetical protein [Rhodanobacteraceae bacterium]